MGGGLHEDHEADTVLADWRMERSVQPLSRKDRLVMDSAEKVAISPPWQGRPTRRTVASNGTARRREFGDAARRPPQGQSTAAVADMRPSRRVGVQMEQNASAVGLHVALATEGVDAFVGIEHDALQQVRRRAFWKALKRTKQLPRYINERLRRQRAPTGGVLAPLSTATRSCCSSRPPMSSWHAVSYSSTKSRCNAPICGILSGRGMHDGAWLGCTGFDAVRWML